METNARDRFLVTTAEERTWPTTGRRLLFLGEWCRLYDRRGAWERLDAEIVPYHWNDRDKFVRDYHDLVTLYEELLRELAGRLNILHGVDCTVRYWRILIGPWLGYFVQILFDRWSQLEVAVRNYAISGVRVIDAPPERLIPTDMSQFVVFIGEDFWNEGIWAQLMQLIEGWWTVPVERVPSAGLSATPSAIPTAVRPRRSLKRTAAHILSDLMRPFTRPDESFFISTYLPRGQDLQLQSRLGQIPKIWMTQEAPPSPVDWGKRGWTLPHSGEASFASAVRAMIPRHIPTRYVEGYVALKDACSRLVWPQRPRSIFTSNAFMTDDVFKAWAAEKVQRGSPLVVGQHGGHYGSALCSFPEYHQREISDRWLSWGWTDARSDIVRAVGNLKVIGRHSDWDPQGHGLMVGMCLPRYSGILISMPLASQWLDYAGFQWRFVSALPERLRAHLLVRLDVKDYRWAQEQRWRDQFPRIRVDSGKTPIARLVAKSRLCISTYNSTTFLESLALNVPTIMVWNPNYFELRAGAIPDFERLKAAGIFHETPESAAAQMALVWDDVSAWWNTERVQATRRDFCHRHSRVGTDVLPELERALCDAASARASDASKRSPS